jgi:hypothetical protein
MKKTIFTFILICLSSQILISKTLKVTQDYSTIQAAIDAAQNLDTILVSEGVYYENISYKGKGIVVTSRYFITNDWQTVLNTVIDGSKCINKDTASVVQFLHNEDSTAVLDGFTITGGSGSRYSFGNLWQEGAGVIMSYSSATVRNNFIFRNTTVPQGSTTDGGGGGIASMYGNPTICNNVIAFNTSGYAGGVVLNWSNGTIRNNIIYHNSCATSTGTGGVMLWRTPAGRTIVENNTIVGNVSNSDAGGINIHTDNPPVIPIVRNNIVWGNRQATGGQVVNAQYGNYNNIEDYSSGTNLSSYPQFQENSFLLSPGSPCIDAGDPDMAFNDIEDPANSGAALLPSRGTLRNDAGAYGGPFAKTLLMLDTTDFYISKDSLLLRCPPGQHVKSGTALFNKSTNRIIIDSITHTNLEKFSLNKNFAGQTMDLFVQDSLIVSFENPVRGIYFDTVKIFHQVSDLADPIMIPITGVSNSIPFNKKPISAQNAYVGQLFTFTIPDSTFLDNDTGDLLTYHATGLPAWLSFDSLSHTFQGNPTTTTGRHPLGIKIIVNDLLQATASAYLNLTVLAAAGVNNEDTQPKEFQLMQNYPNPFNPETIISYHLPAASPVTLKVYDILGREVTTLVNETEPAGSYNVYFNAARMTSGVYFYRLSSNRQTKTKTMILLR